MPNRPHHKTHTIVCDGYDRHVLAGLLRRKSALAHMRDKLARLLPHADALVCDLFCALFKLNVELRPKAELSAAVLVSRRLIDAVLASEALAELRARTQLHPDECAAALPSLIERILSALRREFHISPKALLDAARAAQDEDELAAREAEREHLENLDEIAPEAFSADQKAALKESLERDISQLCERIGQARERQERLADKLTGDLDESVALKISALPDTLDSAGELVDSMGLGTGQTGHTDAARRLELGERLMRSRKLQLLAKLVGAFREVAFDARRRRVARSLQELHSVTTGAHLERLLPSELFGLPTHNRGLHREFLRRLTEGQLLEYELHGASRRGPMVVCVDGSGSMHGSKELWAKAVALTLMEIARREKRRCLAIIFSAGDALFEVDMLDKLGRARGRASIIDNNVLAFAEHFPGGGTDFEQPMSRALDAVTRGNYRRGDIVFITDGHAHVSDALRAQIADKRKKHRFSIRGIAVDVADHSIATLQSFCDEVRQITDLATDSLSDLFTSV